jgi:hypothetical protein
MVQVAVDHGPGLKYIAEKFICLVNISNALNKLGVNQTNTAFDT